jgi:hypothetical protein
MRLVFALLLLLPWVSAEAGERYGNWTFDCSNEAGMCFIALGELPGSAVMMARKPDGDLMLWTEAGDLRYMNGWIQIDRNARIDAMRCGFQNCTFREEDAAALRDQLLQGGQSIGYSLYHPEAAVLRRLDASGFPAALLRLQRSGTAATAATLSR